MIRVWDPLVRVFHWSLVLAFTVAWLAEDDLMGIHRAAGYVLAGLLAFRLVWGVVGPRYARFRQFLHGPRAVRAYLGDVLRMRERRYVGHNPAGGVMIAVMILTLAGTALTGWLADDPARLALLPEMPAVVAPALADEGGDQGGVGAGGELLKDAHELLANLALVLVALHLGGVALASLRHRENLPRAMVTGLKRPPGPDDAG